MTERLTEGGLSGYRDRKKDREEGHKEGEGKV